MKRTLILMAAACVALAACNKEEAAFVEPGEIILSIDDGSIQMGVETKASATAINSVPGTLKWSATTGAVGSEVSKWTSADGTVSAGKIATGKYQTATATTYNYYVSNQAITFAAGGSTISASNTTDVIAGRAASSATNPSVTMGHVFARTGTFTCNTQTGYDISNISWKIQGAGTSGTYNIATGAWSGLTSLAQRAIASGDDLYLVPGTYTITVSYTLTKGDWSKSLTKSGNVTLTAGKINNITCTAIGGDASSISLGVSLTDWTSQGVTLTLS